VELDPDAVQRFLVDRLGLPATEVELIGKGAWSDCFAFRSDDFHYVIRIGPYLDDFEKDRIAAAYAEPRLPIPRVLAVGNGLGGFYAISTRIHGSPLEVCAANDWPALVPSLVAALEVLRTTVPTCNGWGVWGPTGDAPFASWRGFLLAVGDDPQDRRTHGWRAKLAARPAAAASFASFFERLETVAHDDVPRSLVHGDLVNRNVHVEAGRILGIFDWGCSMYGDSLYDLAWFEFWAPWHPNLDVGHLRSAVEASWEQHGYLPEHHEQRRLACLLHIGLDHLAYNAHLDDWDVFDQVRDRLDAFAAGIG